MRIGWFIGVLAVAALSGCSSARMSDHESDSLFRLGRYDEAATHLNKGLEDQGANGRDQLLYLFDLGLTYHSAGKYDQSIKIFRRADDVAVIKDYTSLSRETATLLTSDNIKDYKAEDFENVLINTYLAMNYALEGNVEDALVEARRVNQKLYMMVSEGKRKYKQNAFARYLSAILYESQGNYSDAYVDYKNTYQLEPNYPGLGRDLWRTAKLNEMDDQADEWDEKFHLTKQDHEQAMQLGPKSGKGEIIILYENGISPIKKPNPNFREIPKFYPRPNPVRFAEVSLAPATTANYRVVGDTAMLFNIEATAIENLDEKYAGLIAKKVAGLVAKEAVGYGVARATDSPILGLITKVALYASDQADCRSWNLLPHDLQVLRIPVEPGDYNIKLHPVGSGTLPVKEVKVVAGQKVFVDFRYMP